MFVLRCKERNALVKIKIYKLKLMLCFTRATMYIVAVYSLCVHVLWFNSLAICFLKVNDMLSVTKLWKIWI